MDLEKLLKDKKISKYRLSKDSGVPYSTICDICTGKSDVLKCSAETVVRLGHVLGMSAEEMIGEIKYPETKKKSGKTASDKKKSDKKVSDKKKLEKKTVKKSDETNHSIDFAKKKEESFANYCIDLQNKIDTMGELNFLITYLKNNEVEILYNLNRKKESKYLLNLVDKLCVKYNFPLCKEYDEIRAEEYAFS